MIFHVTTYRNRRVKTLVWTLHCFFLYRALWCKVNMTKVSDTGTNQYTFEWKHPIHLAQNEAEIHLDEEDYTSKADTAIKRTFWNSAVPTKIEIWNWQSHTPHCAQIGARIDGSYHRKSGQYAVQNCLIHTPALAKNIGLIRSLHLPFRYSKPMSSVFDDHSQVYWS